MLSRLQLPVTEIVAGPGEAADFALAGGAVPLQTLSRAATTSLVAAVHDSLLIVALTGVAL